MLFLFFLCPHAPSSAPNLSSITPDSALVNPNVTSKSRTESLLTLWCSQSPQSWGHSRACRRGAPLSSRRWALAYFWIGPDAPKVYLWTEHGSALGPDLCSGWSTSLPWDQASAASVGDREIFLMSQSSRNTRAAGPRLC